MGGNHSLACQSLAICELMYMKDCSAMLPCDFQKVLLKLFM